ncbi:MAG: RluA family pseudouridine synthase [Acidimicrobiales bacterium]
MSEPDGTVPESLNRPGDSGDTGAGAVVEIPHALAGERVDRVVALLSGCTRAQVQKLIAAGGVRLADVTVSAGSRRVKAGERLETNLELLAATARPQARPAAPGEVAFRVVFEDQAVIVIDKPPGVVVHPDAAHHSGTLVAGLLASYPELARLPELGCGEADRPGIVHRLDKDTSGLLVVARSPEAYRSLTGQLAARTVHRSYLALACGALEAKAGVVDAPIGRSLRHPTRMAVAVGGRAARTHYEVLQSFELPLEATYLELRLETGRTHQIRVHLAAIGHPVVGDARYGGDRRRSGAPRTFLHAGGLCFVHPVTGLQASFDSPLPGDLAAVLERFS